ncbi:MAG: protein kinase domain-containing protein, partial [Planctomycetota bacterium]
MVQNPPHDPTVNGPTRHRSIAWPSDIVYSDRQKTKFAGFIMPRIDTKVFVKLLYYIDPRDRVKRLQGAFTWLHLHAIGRNLASCLAAIHERGYCVGDINESNILVAGTTPLTIIDCDSFQIEDHSSGEVWLCRVGKQEYTAPEVLEQRYDEINRTKETDCFALAVVLFQLLMEGFHPYAASGKLVDDAPTPRDKIRKGLFPYTSPKKGIAPPPDAPSFNILHPDIQNLFHRSFQTGHKEPSARPSAKEWMAVLDKTPQHFTKCTTNENHRFLVHLNTCPWCDRARKTKKDRFPSPIGQQIKLPDPTSQIVSLDDRKAWLLPIIEAALVDG